jgi:glutathione synthase/RimK-type ligase-like ATP-grasp enzyme
MILNEKVTIVTEDSNQDKNIIQISETIFIKWNLVSSKEYLLQCGDQSCYVSFLPYPDKKKSLLVTDFLMKELYLPQHDISLNLYFHQDNEVFSLGLFIGLLTEIKETEDGPSFGSVHDFCNELAIYCDRNSTLFYVFSLRHTKFNYYQGYIWNGSDWELKKVPLPHVVHNRIHSRKREKSASYQKLYTQLKEYNIPFFNDHFLNKWESHKNLLMHEHLLPYLPETDLLLNKQILEEFLERHTNIFIKPVHGSQGKKIIRIEKKDGEYILDYTTFSGEIEKVFSTPYELFVSLRPRLLKQSFIIQQGIPLLQYKDRILDFRFLCHLNDMNQWKVTSSVARVSSKHEFVSNVARGGEIYRVNKILTKLFDQQTALHVSKMLYELAIEVASAIGQSEEGLFGELGIDLAIDNSAKPWIIEINTKPSKNMDSNTSNLTVRPSAKAVIHYCLYLANPFKRSDFYDIPRISND